MTHDTPSLDTLRAMYPVASGSLTEFEMGAASRLANLWYIYIKDYGVLGKPSIQLIYAQRATHLATPVSKAAFALLLTMVDG